MVLLPQSYQQFSYNCSDNLVLTWRCTENQSLEINAYKTTQAGYSIWQQGLGREYAPDHVFTVIVGFDNVG